MAGVDSTGGSLSTTLFTFTRQNWNRQQSLIGTGIDDTEADGDVADSLRLDTSSADTLYEAVPDTMASVVNLHELAAGQRHDDDVAPLHHGPLHPRRGPAGVAAATVSAGAGARTPIPCGCRPG